MSRYRQWSAAVGVLMLLVYVLPLFAPPAATSPVPPTLETEFWARVFPGVPMWWVTGRLLCLVVGSVLVALSTGRRVPLTLDAPVGARGTDSAPAARPRAEGLALLLAGAQAALGFFASQFSRRAETVYFAFLAVPAAVVAGAEWPRLRPLLRRWRWRWMWLLIIPLSWLAICLPMAWRSPRAANVVDMWVLIERLQRVVRGEQRILSDSAQPGHTNAYMMLEGVPALGAGGVPVTFVGLQAVHALAAAACAVAAGAAVWQIVGPAAAPVAQAALLFSPYGLSSLYEPAPMFFTALCTSLLLFLLVLARRFRSRAAVVAFGTVAGVSSTDPPVVLIALLLCALMVVSLGRFDRVPWRALAAGVFAGAAAVTPSFPSPAMFREMVSQYTLGRGQLVAVVRILFGQDTPYTVSTALQTGQAGPLDLPVGSLLAPFAIARTPLRIWGDVLFEPIAAAFMAIGLVLCVVHGRRNRAAAFFMILLLTGLIGGFTAEGDAVSHTRLAPALIPIAVMTAVGFEAVRRALAARWRPHVVGSATAGVVALSGLVIFAKVTPAIEPSSWLAIGIEALGGDHAPADAVFLTYDEPRNPKPGEPWNLRWLFVEPIASLLPARPSPTRTISQLSQSEASTPAQLYPLEPGPGRRRQRRQNDLRKVAAGDAVHAVRPAEGLPCLRGRSARHGVAASPGRRSVDGAPLRARARSG
jgi:hypothetical protein